MSLVSRSMFYEIVTLMKLILVMPATNAASERTFSVLRRVKTYLRSTMTQERLNQVMILHTRREGYFCSWQRLCVSTGWKEIHFWSLLRIIETEYNLSCG